MTEIGRRDFITIAMLSGLTACGGDDPPPPPAPIIIQPPPPPPPPPAPTIASVTLRASPFVNPDPGGQAKPVQVSLFRLASTAAFDEANYFALAADPNSVLGADLIGVETLTMAPGTNEVFQWELDDGTRYLGLVAGYRNLEGSVWRTSYQVEQNTTSLITGEIDLNSVSFRPGL